MKKILVLATLALAVSLMAVTIQASAAAAPAPTLKKTPGPPATFTPGAPQPPAPSGVGSQDPPGLQGNPPGPQETPGAKANEQAGQQGKTQVMRGTISAVDLSSLVLTLTDGSSVTVALSPDTRIHVPGSKGSGGTLLVGMQVVVMARADQAGNLVARAVMVVPGRPSLVHRVGTVTAYAAGASITIQATDGNSYAFTLSSAPKILPAERASTLAVGSRVTIIAPRDPSSLGWTARGIVVHPSAP